MGSILRAAQREDQLMPKMMSEAEPPLFPPILGGVRERKEKGVEIILRTN